MVCWPLLADIIESQQMRSFNLITVLFCLNLLFWLSNCSAPNADQSMEPSTEYQADQASKKTVSHDKRTPAPQLGTLEGAESVAFNVGVNTIMTFFPIAFYEDLMRNRIRKDSEEKTGNPQAFINQFSLVRSLRGPEYKLIATPNNDTYYAQAYCEVNKEPLVFQIPEMEADRYYVFQIWDPYGDTFRYLGSRTIGNKGGSFVFVGPDFKGNIPKGLPLIRAPFNNFVIWGRIGVLPIEDDKDKVHAIQDQLKLSYLSDYTAGNVTTPAHSESESLSRLAIDIPKDLPEGLEWYYKISEALKHTPVSAQDSALLVSMEYIGYSNTGKSFNYSDLSSNQLSGLQKGSQYALYLMDVVAQSVGEEINGWRWSPRSGILGNDYLFRAAWAKWYTGGNSAEEAIYLDGRKDDQGEPFSSDKKYQVHFDRDQLPQVKAFWSISIYNQSDGSFVTNEINRYSIGSNTQEMTYNDDGSLDIFIQALSPVGATEKSNWLPSPKSGGFYLDLRLYNPDKGLQNGTWEPPMVKVIK